MSIPSLATDANVQFESSITSTSSASCGSPDASRRPVVIWTAPPTRANGIRWRAASAWRLLIPGITS
jgi:hypothetical protein